MVAFLAAHLSLFVQPPILGPGDMAPKLSIKEWIKGSQIKELAAGKTYIVEFWATWCGPCIEGIPNLSELAKNNPNVTVLSVAVWQRNDKKEIQEFVKSMGDKMAYNIAYTGDKDGMAVTWLDAAKQNGIPCSFIVKDRKIMWIGHPGSLDKPLKAVQDGTFDLAKAQATFQKQMKQKLEGEAIDKDIAACEALFDTGKREEAKSKLADLEAKYNRKLAAETKSKWKAFEDPEQWKADALVQMEKGEQERVQLCFFANANAVRLPEISKWLIDQLCTDKFPPDWYPWLNGGRVYYQLKEYDKALTYTAKAREIILDFQKKNPDAPKGNALDVIKELEEKIKKGA